MGCHSVSPGAIILPHFSYDVTRCQYVSSLWWSKWRSGGLLKRWYSPRPLFVSAGYWPTLAQALEVTLRGSQLPEPARAADHLDAATRHAALSERFGLG